MPDFAAKHAHLDRFAQYVLFPIFSYPFRQQIVMLYFYRLTLGFNRIHGLPIRRRLHWWLVWNGKRRRLSWDGLVPCL